MNRHNHIMKRTIALIAVVAILVGLVGGALVAQNQKYQQKQNESAKQAEAKLQAERVEKDNLVVGLKSSLEATVEECKKGKVAYDALTPQLKLRLQAPACPTVPIQ